jgi:uncharacterized membrane protein YfcA
MTFSVAGISLNPLVPFFWSLFVGLVFSMVGAAGGILAGVGHITIFGMGDANMIKPMNQLLVIVSPLIAVPNYWRQNRVVLSLAFLLGLGSVVGSLVGSWYSKNYLPELHQYGPLFGVIVLLVSVRLFYETTKRFRKSHGKMAEASKAFEVKSRELHGDSRPVSHEFLRTNLSSKKLSIRFLGQEFHCNPFLPVIAGLGVAYVSAALGVGGGFLLVPFMASWLQLPMFIVAGTSALAVLVASVTSVSNYLYLGVQIDWSLAAIELAGVVLGSLLGPFLSRYMKEQWLRAVLAIVLLYVGIGYTIGPWIKSWLGISII